MFHFKFLNPAILRRPHFRTRHCIIIFLLGLLALLPGNALLPMIDRDEPRFTQATREMIQRDDWVIPYFNGEYRFDKPILIYWMMRASFVFFGVNEFAARLPSVLMTLLIAFAIYEFGRRWIADTTAFFAACGWLTCFQIFIHGRLAVADMPMVLAVALTHWAIFEILFSKKKYQASAKKSKSIVIQFLRETDQWFWILYLSLGLGFLAKGPVSWFCPILTLALFRWVFWRKPMEWSRLKLHVGAPLVIAIVAAWGIPALIKTHGQFWQVGINEHIVQRGLETFNSRIFLPFYYFITAFLSLFPWMAFVGFAWTAVRAKWSRQNAFLVAWAIGPYLIFSLYKTQLPHYTMPAFPAIFLLLAQGLRNDFPKKTWHQAIFWSVIGGAFVLALALISVGVFEKFTIFMRPLKVTLLCFAGIIFCWILAALWLKKGLRWSVLFPFIGVALCTHVFAASLRPLSPAARLAEIFPKKTQQGEFFFKGFEEPSMVFYSNQKWKTWDGNLGVLRGDDSKMLVRLQKESKLENYLALRLPKIFRSKTSSFEELNDRQIKELVSMGYRSFVVEGINFARTSWVKIDAWYRP